MTEEIRAMADDTAERLSRLNAKIDRGRTELARAEATVEQLKVRREEILGELDQLGVKTEDLDETIKRLEEERDRHLDAAERLLEGV